MHTIAAKAISFAEALQPSFRVYQQQVIDNAQALAKGLAAENLRLVSGGTDNHLVCVDVGSRGLTGKEIERNLDLVHITVNKNTIPFETKSPFVTSGVRVGTPAITTRGLKTEEMDSIANCIAPCLQ